MKITAESVLQERQQIMPIMRIVDQLIIAATDDAIKVGLKRVRRMLRDLLR